MATRVLVCKTSGEITFADIEDLAGMQSIVGGLVAIVDCGYVDCYCNDEGLLIGLEPNPSALAICRSFGCDPGHLVGDVFFAGGVDSDGEILCISREQATRAATVAIKSRIERATVAKGARQ
jgi:hypothetical protein